MRAAYEQSRILARRENIQTLIERPETPDDERRKLQLVLDTRDFALRIGLKPKGAFTKYANVEREVLAWVVSGSKKDTFALYTWWFPFVGRVPYKGFFEHQDAEQEAIKLREQDYETWLRGTEAMSSLGWFNDPILSTTLRHGAVHIVNTVLHESLHSTVWVKGQVEFNEGLAQFVGDEASLDFFEARLDACSPGSSNCIHTEQSNLEAARRQRAQDLDLASLLLAVYGDLNALYQSGRSKEEILSERQQIFARHIAPLHRRYPQLGILREINNAEILQLKLYLGGLEKFAPVLASVNRDWHAFLNVSQAVKERVDKTSGLDPFAALTQLMDGNHDPNNLFRRSSSSVN